MKRSKILLFTAAAALSLNAVSFSAVYGGSLTTVVKGQKTASAVVIDGRTFISLRGFSDVTGAETSLSDDGTVVVSMGVDEVIMKADSNIMSVNGEDIETEAAAQIIESEIMLPLRAVSEALGAEVSWDGETKTVTVTTAEAAQTVSQALSKIDSTKWQYNEESGVYWQVGINYCSNPVDLTYETMGIFVPQEYMTTEANGDGTYTCTVNTDGQINGYTSETAPMVIPVNTPGYSAMKAPTGYVSGAESYTSQGFIYVNPGCRGRDAGAPTGVTDLKAAVRYIRYSAENIPGSTDRIFTFGMSGGGAQSALMGATGNSVLYTPYLQAIGAVEGYSDAVAGSMCWCPITNLDYANEAYEWNLGVTRTDLDEDMQSLSDGLAYAYADYINGLGLKDEKGNLLTLEESESGIYQAGSYYDYIKGVIENSLNNFLSDTAFPYTPASTSGRGNFGGGNFGGENMPEGDLPDGDMAGDVRIEDLDGITRNETTDDTDTEEKTYETPADYIASLNSDSQWVIYDSETNTAEITSVEDFVKNCKKASKSLGAFDQLDRGQGENTLFGYGDGSGAHFDSVMAELLKGTGYEADFNADLSKKDSVGNTAETRVNMYTPLYYISSAYSGFGTADVADFWRIRTGINQSDTALSTEVNLALALEAYGKDVDFETVWGQAHVEAERSGSSSDNFIAWVNECLK
ncbi:MAG: copper amine oxidase N-terminal domain-containing protein [Clostridiales bacterium]|nr:copper amine oxidase N-terminal domain-containing protein [Clostridiales bacterium]